LPVGLQENLLSNVFRVGRIGRQTQRGAEHHVLVVPHEHLELLRACHGPIETIADASYARNDRRRKTVAWESCELCILCGLRLRPVLRAGGGCAGAGRLSPLDCRQHASGSRTNGRMQPIRIGLQARQRLHPFERRVDSGSF
jgi:hypothetical protein